MELTTAEDYTSLFTDEDMSKYFINTFLNRIVLKIIANRTFNDNNVVDTANRLLFLFTEFSIKVMKKGKHDVAKGLKKILTPDMSWY